MNTPFVSDTLCQRCGTCCLKGGPGLHQADAGLFSGQEALPLSHIVTFRAGEPVYDQPRGQVLPLERELLKLRGAPGATACAHYSAKTRACGLYTRRPEQCRALSCQDTSALAAMYDQNRLRREDLLPQGHPVLAVIAEHERLVPVARIAPLAEDFRQGGQQGREAEAELSRMAGTDAAFRLNLAERAGIGPEYHDYFFGREARLLYAAVGLSLRRDARLGCRIQADPLWRNPAQNLGQRTGDANER